jgi:hypothetical protein
MTNREQKQLAGRASGLKKLQQHGTQVFSEMGHKGGRPRSLTADEIRALALMNNRRELLNPFPVFIKKGANCR